MTVTSTKSPQAKPDNGISLATTATRRFAVDRVLSLFAEVRAGEGVTAILMIANIFILLVCYAVIKAVREPLILLAGGAEVRSYAAAGQALLAMAFVPVYGWYASRFDRRTLLVGISVIFIACIELFAGAVAADLPYVGVAFFIWVGLFNMALVTQFWSFANDIYTQDAGERIFPIIMLGMTAGPPLGSLTAGRLFRSGLTCPVILQAAAVLMAASAALYLWVHAREQARAAMAVQKLSARGSFRLVFGNPYLRRVVALLVLVNIVSTTGEYLMARLVTSHAEALARGDVTFNPQVYIGAFSGDYQLWVNIAAFVLQACATSRLVKSRGLRWVLLSLPMVALGGYMVIAAGAGFSIVRWIKTAENATDYSMMNTARQLLWLKTTREEKYQAKQTIDTFFVRAGDVVSAAVVYVGASVLHLTSGQFAAVNLVLTTASLVVALQMVGVSALGLHVSCGADDRRPRKMRVAFAQQNCRWRATDVR